MREDLPIGYSKLTLRGHNDHVDAVAFSSDGKRLATASGDKTAKVWDAESGKELLTLRRHSDSVLAVAFSRDGKRLATPSADHTAKVWKAESSKELLTLRGHSNSVYAMAFSPDGTRLATSSADGTVQIYALDPHELLNLARSRVTRTSRLRSANATSSPSPARPCLKFRMLHDQAYSFTLANDSPCKQMFAKCRLLTW